MKGITFGNYHSYDDFHLILGSQEIGSPDIKENKIKIEGADGDLDFTDFFGSPKYENVRHKFNFSTIVPQAEFLSLFSTVKNAIHGKKLRVILDDDPLFYYTGRCFVSKFTNEKGIGILSVECDCEPYKYKTDVTREKVFLYGKNLIDVANFEQGNLTATLGETFLNLKTTSTTRLRSKNVFYIKSKTQYTLTIPEGFQLTFRQFDKNGRMVQADGWRTGLYSFITDENADSIAFMLSFLETKTMSPSDVTDAGFQLEEGNVATEYEPFDGTEKTVSVFLENLKKPAVPTIISQHEVTITNGEETLVAREEEPLVSPEFQLSEGINQFNITGIGLVAFEWQEGGL